MQKSRGVASGVEGLIEEGEAFDRLRAEARSTPAGRRSTFHAGMSVAFLVTAFAGFAPTYYLKALSHAPPLSPLVHVHGLVFTAWLLLLFTQSALVAAHRIDLHRRLGVVGAVLAATMLPVGILTATAAARRGVAPPGFDPLVFLIFPITSVALFAGFIGAAMWRRRQPESHRRLMLLATISLMTPAIARLPVVGTRPVVGLLLSTLFVLAAMLNDWKARRPVHPSYLWGGLIILLSGPARFGLGHTEVWRSLARFLVE